jgi:GTPase involved in cell partitioning and DNA repair
MIVVATKLDATTDQTKLEELRAFCAEKGLEFHAISAPTGDGVKELVRAMADALDKIPKETLDDETEDAAIDADEDMDGDIYEAADDSESDEPGPPIPKVS